MSPPSIASASRSGNASGVHANAGMPSAPRAAALDASNDGAPSSDSASSATTDTPAARNDPRRDSSDDVSPPSYRSEISTKIVSRGLVISPWQ